MTARLYSLSCLLGALLAVPAVASATILDFEDAADNYNTSVPSGGFIFQIDAAGWGVITDAYTENGRASNGSTSMIFAGTRANTSYGGNVTFKPLNDSAFSMQSFDAAGFFGAIPTGSITVIGYYEAGGTTTQTFDITNSWGGFTLNGSFVGLDHVLIAESVPSGFGVGSGVQLDNIQVNAVPEPATLAALGLGIAALRRRQKSKA